MDHSRLLLLIGLISFHLPEVQGAPTDFWCNSGARKCMLKKIENLRKDMANCMGSDTLPSPIQLPCVWIHAAQWATKTVQKKSAEVMGGLQGFYDAVQKAIIQIPSSTCHTSVLGELKHRITTYKNIVSYVYEQNDTPQPVIQHCSNETSLNTMLEQYEKLLRGKLERLAIDLRFSMCKGDHIIPNNCNS
ncbi:thrombopoietin-like isoform X2 [Anabas testudineus]|uniref:Uncharacterized protein n=1 Tax=Anabas testudineus TaxID=64144 RepID=A0A3Q1J4V5_ANATE|nr:thrombopoietin-like isoform X2 [Anabas testudineus]